VKLHSMQVEFSVLERHNNSVTIYRGNFNWFRNCGGIYRPAVVSSGFKILRNTCEKFAFGIQNSHRCSYAMKYFFQVDKASAKGFCNGLKTQAYPKYRNLLVKVPNQFFKYSCFRRYSRTG